MYRLPDFIYEEEFITQLIELMNREDLAFTLSIMDYKIPGFSKKNYNLVPDTILNRHANKAFKKINIVKNYYSSVIKLNEKNYSSLTQEEFIIKLDQNESIPQFVKFILIACYYPQLYLENKEKLMDILRENEKISKFLLSNPSEILEVKTKIVLEDSLQKLNDLFRNVIPNIDEMDDANKKDLLNQGLKILQTKYEKRNDFQITKVKTETDKLNLSLLLIYEILCQSENFLKDKDKAIEDLNKRIEEEKKSKDVLISEIKSIKFNLEKLEEKYLELKEKYEKEVNLLNYQKDIEIKQKESLIQELNNKIQKLREAMDNDATLKQELKLIDEDVEIFLFNKNKVIEVVFGKDRTHYVDSINQLLQEISNIENRIVFIVTNNISTKDQFKIESQLRKNKQIRYRFISEDTKKVIRTSISYLEGELRYEIIQ